MNTQTYTIHKEGQHYTIDKGKANEGRVNVVTLLGNGFAIIKDSDTKDDYEWVVKLDRLTELKSSN